jgi:glycosyltransferase involved in cell wall biosynthesis
MRASVERYTVQLATEESGFLVDQAKALGISVVPLRQLVMPIHPMKDILAIRGLSDAIRQFRPHLIHAHSSKAGLLTRIAARIHNVPCVFTAHGWGFSDGVPQSRKWIVLVSEWLAGRLGSTIIAVSEFDRNLALRYRIGSPSRIVTIVNGIRDDGIRAIPEHGDPPIITMVARFSPQKDHITLLEALSTVQLPFNLWFVGDGPLLAQAQSCAERLKLLDRTKFCGTSSSVPELLQKSHIFSLISHHEGLPISILEAMRAGLPIVATDTGGVSDAVCHGWNGLLVSRNDARSVKHAIELLLGNPDLRAQFGRNSRIAFEEKFNVHAMVDKTFSIYESILGEQRSRLSLDPISVSSRR